MNREQLLKLISGKKVLDYSYAFFFFIVFSFFIVAVIRPNIITVFNLEKELRDLQVVNDSYTTAIDKIISYQSLLELTRDKIYVLDQSLPSIPQINRLIEDINSSASSNKLIIEKMTIDDINLKKDKNKKGIDNVEINLVIQSEYEDLIKFLNTLTEQRRLKTIKTLSIKKDEKSASDSSKLNIKLVIDSYYL